MKKLVLLSAAVISLSASAFAASGKKAEKMAMKKTEITNSWSPSYFTEDAFYRDFGNLPVIAWDQVGAFTKASFLQNGQTISAYYDRNNELIGTTTAKRFRDLPEKARMQIREKYADYTVKNIIYFDENEANGGSFLLYNQPEDQDNYFVELSKPGHNIVLQVGLTGHVSYFADMN
ncbi:MAG TPA: hypothetical protein VG842_12280 [Sediminibacterium sp.]|nr:hypothetical protein [Sediminibacterium sp.]